MLNLLKHYKALLFRTSRRRKGIKIKEVFILLEEKEVSNTTIDNIKVGKKFEVVPFYTDSLGGKKAEVIQTRLL